MKGFLARWAEGEVEKPATQTAGDGHENLRAERRVASENAVSVDVQANSARMEEHRKPWLQWKAAELNNIFQEQGVTGKPGRITAETISDQITREAASQAKAVPSKKREPIAASEPVSTAEDPIVIEARREIAGLLAGAYRRLAAIRRVETDLTENSVKGTLQVHAH